MHTQKIRELNDAFRTTLTGGKVMITRSLFERPDLDDILRRVRSFKAFTAENDPYCEHDFGAFEAGPDSIFWKIDYYNADLSGGSEDPADAAKTARVLTVMLAEEY